MFFNCSRSVAANSTTGCAAGSGQLDLQHALGLIGRNDPEVVHPHRLGVGVEAGQHIAEFGQRHEPELQLEADHLLAGPSGQVRRLARHRAANEVLADPRFQVLLSFGHRPRKVRLRRLDPPNESIGLGVRPPWAGGQLPLQIPDLCIRRLQRAVDHGPHDLDEDQ